MFNFRYTKRTIIGILSSYRDIPLIKDCSITDQKSIQFGEPQVSNIFFDFEMSLKFGK
ncbi:hypothetical protein ES708_01985 [subsurface metagenome]